MSRPKPNVLLEYTNKKNYRCEQILDAEAIWAVFYKENPFNLKSSNALTNYPGPKYKKTSFSNHTFSEGTKTTESTRRMRLRSLSRRPRSKRETSLIES